MKVNDNQELLKQKPKTFRRSKIRFLALVLACLLLFGNNYSFDNPQALQAQMTKDLDISISQYNLLYSAFSFPNIFLTLLGGLIVDFFGVRFGLVLFCALVVVAQTIIAIGGWMTNYYLMLCGRVLFGIASENLVISQAAITGKWFRGKELSTAIGYIMTVPEIASAANSFITPSLYEKDGSLILPLFVSVGICIFSFLCAVLLVLLDKKADDQEAQTYFIDENDQEAHEEEHIEKVSFEDIKNLSGTFWILVLICTLILGSYVPFLDDANDFLQEKFDFSPVEAGRVLTIPYLVSAFTSPFVGPMIDKVGRRRLFIIFTCSAFAVTHFLFGILDGGTEDNPNWMSLLPLITLGCCYTMYSCVLIPSVQYVVEERIMGTAFGLLGMFEAIALAAFPIFAAYIVETNGEDDKQTGYSLVGYFFSGISMIAVLLTSSLYLVDKKGSCRLDFINPNEPTTSEIKKLKSYDDSSSSSSESSDSEEEDDEDESMKAKTVGQRTPVIRQEYMHRTYSLSIK